MAKEIYLSKGVSAIVDDEDYEWLNQWKWSYRGGYAIRKDRDIKTPIIMHRLIMNAPEGISVDHKNLNRADNRKSNLRLATSQQQQYNQRSRGGTSSYKGVSWKRNRWCAKMNVDGKSLYIGMFLTEEEAAKAYDKKAKEIHGEFAYLNFPDTE